jgi:hypothetical protein
LEPLALLASYHSSVVKVRDILSITQLTHFVK